MSKIKKILFGVLLTVLTLLVLANSFFLYIIWTSTPRGIEINVLENTFYKSEDVEYIRADVARPDPKIVEDGKLKPYSGDEIQKDISEAIKKRDEKNEANSAAN